MKRLATLFSVLADESRLQILWLLLQHPELCVCDLMTALQVPQSKASRHLAILRAADLVTDRRQGQWTHYSLNRNASEPVLEALALVDKALTGTEAAQRLQDNLNSWLKAKATSNA